MEIEIDFSHITSSIELHAVLNGKFGFFEGYGNNIHALIDCWSSLRIPEDKMLEISLEENEQVLLKMTGISDRKLDLINIIIIAAAEVNYRNNIKQNKSSIITEPTSS